MGLYLTIYDVDHELEGVEIGSYDDFSTFRSNVVAKLEGGAAGSRCPTLILHSDCDGHWTPNEAEKLENELESVAACFKELPPIPLNSYWQEQVAITSSVKTQSLYDCFFDVDGQPLIERLLLLARLSQRKNLPILFQ